MAGEHGGDSGNPVYTMPNGVKTKDYNEYQRAMAQAAIARRRKRRTTSSSSTTRRSSSSGGGGYSSSSGGGGGGSSSVSKPAPPISINDFLSSDSTYSAQLAALNKAIADYTAQQDRAKGRYDVDYGSRKRDLGTARERSLDEQENDFASRGILFSGVYGQDVNKLVTDFARRQSDMDIARANYAAGLADDLSNFRDERQLSMTKAKQDAVNRYNLRYGSV
jgi:hypothetical protein